MHNLCVMLLPAGPTEITAFSDRHAEFKNIGAEVLGVSVDSQFTHLAWIQTDRKEGECWGGTHLSDGILKGHLSA